MRTRGYVFAGRQRIGDHTAQSLNHRQEGNTQHVLFGERLGLDGEVPARDLIGNGRGVAQVVDQVVDRIFHALMIALAINLHPLRQVAEADLKKDAIALRDRQNDRIQHAVDPGDELGEVTDEVIGRPAFGELASRRRGDQPLKFRRDGSQVSAQRFNRLVDEGLLAREFFERSVEIAFAERLHAGHGLLLHGNVARDHIIDALGHIAKVALEPIDRHEDVDVALVVLDRHMIHFTDQTIEIAAQRLDRLVDEGLLARELLERRFKITFTQRLDAGHGLLLDADVAGDHVVDALGHIGKIALEAIDGDEDVDVALVVLRRHSVHFVDQPAQVAAQRLDRVVDEGLLAGKLFKRGIEIAFAELLDAGHRLFLHANVPGHHVVEGRCHDGKFALEILRHQPGVDVSLIMVVRHNLDGGLQLLHGLSARIQNSIQRRQYISCVASGDIEICTLR